MTGPLTLAWVEGTYLSTTVAISRHEHVAPAGLGGRARATMVVDDSTVRWEREGSDVVRVGGAELLGVSLERGFAATLLGRAQTVLVEWSTGSDTSDTTDTTDKSDKSDKDGDRNVTRFLPRARADSGALVAAVQRLMDFGPASDHPTTTPDGDL